MTDGSRALETPQSQEPLEGGPRLIETGSSIDLASTLSAFRVGGYDPSLRIGPDGVWRASRTPEGPSTLHLRQVPSDMGAVVHATAWGPGAQWALVHAHELIGLNDNIDSFTPTDRLIVDLHRRHRGLRFGRSRSIVEALIPAIIEQKVTSVEAHRSFNALVRALGENAPGPTPDTQRGPLMLRPDPARLASLGYSDFHPLGIERRRAETILRVCRRAPTLDSFALDVGGESEAISRSVEDARAALESLPGIGVWTSATVIQQAFGDPDAAIVGDYHLPNLVAWNLAGEARGSDDRMLELLAPYVGHRARVVRLLSMGGRRAPRRGPGHRLRSIADH